MSRSATESRLPFCKRRDLVARQQSFGDRRYWVIKDPVAMRYHHLADEEYSILQMIDGGTSLAEIRTQFEQRFAPQRLKVARMESFLAELYRHGLIASDARGQGEPLLQQRGRRRQREVRAALANVLAVRLRGIDPERFLAWLVPKVGGLFRGGCLVLWLLLAVSALALVTLRFDELLAGLPEFRAFFTPRNLIWLALSMAGVKVLHELGHAVACKQFGGECHELGLMLLVFTPCLYCDVSDSWLLPSKWHRMAIAAAGLYVEIFLAAVSTLLWWISEPGLLNSLCLNIMLVCSVSTLIFNGNPLMRYDGYYLLSDLLEVPNLESRSRALLWRGLGRWCLGLDLANRRMVRDERPILLATYAVLSMLYRGFVFLAIYFFLERLLEPYRLQVVAEGLLAAAMLGIAATMIVPLQQQLSDPSVRRRINPRRLVATLVVLVAFLLLATVVPIPLRIDAPVMLEPAGGRWVTVSAPGNLVWSVRAGDQVRPGQTLAVLEDLELEAKLARLQGERNQQAVRVRSLEILRGVESGADIPAAQERLSQLDSLIAELRKYQQQLSLVAPIGGTVFPPPRRSQDASSPTRLPTWVGTPLDRNNVGSYLERNTPLCLIGDPSRWQAAATIDQADVDFVQPGQSARIRLDQSPGIAWPGTVLRVSRLDLLDDDSSPWLSVAELPTRTDRYGRRRPLTTLFEAHIALERNSQPALVRAFGRCKIAAAAQPLAIRVYRSVRQTFRWRT